MQLYRKQSQWATVTYLTNFKSPQKKKNPSDLALLPSLAGTDLCQREDSIVLVILEEDRDSFRESQELNN